MSILDFYCYDGQDPYGRTILDLIAMTDGQLESSHDVIQRFPPLHEESNFNPECPIIDRESAKLLRSNVEAQKRIHEAILRFMRFLGFDYQLPPLSGGEGKFVHDPLGDENRKNWRRPRNHNHLRITRVIRSLRLFGLEEEAQRVFDAVYQSATDAICISDNTARYWYMALQEDPFETLRK